MLTEEYSVFSNKNYALALYEEIPSEGGIYLGDIDFVNGKINRNYTYCYNSYRDAISKAYDFIKMRKGKIVKKIKSKRDKSLILEFTTESAVL